MYAYTKIFSFGIPGFGSILNLNKALGLVGNAPLFQVKKMRHARVLCKKYPIWFFKMAAGVFIYFEDVMMEMIENYFKSDMARKK
jgi:hypothetical protein